MREAHTQGRVTFKEDGDANHYSMLTEDGRWWLAVLANGEQTSERQIANFRRLAACWNRLLPFSTRDIEDPAVDLMGANGWIERYNTALMQVELLQAQRDQMKAQRDQLHAVLGRIIGACDACEADDNKSLVDEFTAEMEAEARDVIQKVRSGE